ncbi:hypothetical Protein YC6258_05918 [Gynuella sunshinyii YC6258]|uniref:Uncharacterized protein n=1 Tax=Gynuella sunshinyii YC6258 TaxID=1445510 RepID=A0A0C5VTD1_9GAMM|nr:hypothetical Protein YC6258_05918 [Gynuella sunshinyii YC6258]
MHHLGHIITVKPYDPLLIFLHVYSCCRPDYDLSVHLAYSDHGCD